MIADPFLHDPLPRIIIPATLLCAKKKKDENSQRTLREKRRDGEKGGRKEEGGGRGTEVTIHGRSQPGEIIVICNGVHVRDTRSRLWNESV